MKTEDFDDAIRRKLESVSRSHGQEEVDAIHQYVEVRRTKISKSRLGLIISLSGCILMIGSLFFWNMLQLNEIKSLKQQIVQIGKTAKKERSVPKNEKSSTPLGQVAGKILPLILKSATTDVPHAHGRPSTENDISSSVGEMSAPRAESSKTNETKALSAPMYTSASRHHGTEGIADKRVVNDSVPGYLLSSAITDSVAGTETATRPDKMKESAELKAGADSIHYTNKSNSSLNNAIIGATQKADSVTIANVGDAALYTKTWIYRAGVGLEAGNQQLGFGLLGEAVYKKHFAVSIGIKLLKNGEERFDDDDDYDDHKKKEFKKAYGNQVDDNSKNIKIRNTVLQIPLAISYVFSLKHNFSILAGIGTDIDIYTRQHIEYHHVNVANDLQTNQFVTNYPPAFFNNLVFTGGIQKQIHRFIFQLSPYVSPQLKQVDYKKEDCYFGLRFRTFFEF